MKRLVAVAMAVLCAVAQAETTDYYVQDGLVACWDGYENGGRLKHEEAPNAWVDVVGGLEVTIPDWVTVEETAMLSAANRSKTAPTLDSISGADEASVITVEQVIQNTGWTYTDSYNNLQNVFSTPRGSVGYRQDNAKGFYYFGPSSTTKISLQNWVHAKALVSDLHTVSGVFGSDKGTDAIYMDAVQDTVSFSSYSENYGSKYSFFGNPRAGIRVCSIRVYNRKLTADEIAANRAVDVKRFVEGNFNDPPGVRVQGYPRNYATAAGEPQYGVYPCDADEEFSMSVPESFVEANGHRVDCLGWKLYDSATGAQVAESGEQNKLRCVLTYFAARETGLAVEEV